MHLPPGDAPAPRGQAVADLETPALTVDLDAVERNVAEFASFADDHGVRLRSHAKTHKTPAFAHYQDRITGGGILCQTLGEAETFAAAGIDDVYLSHMVVGGSKLRRLVRLAESLSDFATTVDCPGNVDPLQAAAADRGATVDAVVEIDLGYERTGVAPADAPGLVERVAAAPNLRFGGLMGFEAHVKADAETREDYERLCRAAMDDLAAVVDRVEDAGVAVPDVKVGSTATSKFSGRHPVVTEINPGMYPFNDVGELQARPWDVTKADCAATVRSTVVSHPASDRVVVDAGSKSLAMDSGRSPVAKRRDDVDYYRASEEHGWIDAGDAPDLAVGDRIEFVPPHVCTTINLHDVLYGVRDGVVVDAWRVQARGAVR